MVISEGKFTGTSTEELVSNFYQKNYFLLADIGGTFYFEVLLTHHQRFHRSTGANIS